MTLNSVSINLPASVQLSNARGAAIAAGSGVSDRESRGRNEQLAPEAESVQVGESSRLIFRDSVLEPVLALDDLPPQTRNAITTYLSAQNAVFQPAPDSAENRQSIVGVDLFV